MIKLKEIYWLAGFIEGEGSFRIQVNSRNPNTRRFHVQITSTDRDVLEKAAFILSGTTYICAHHKERKLKATYKLKYSFNISISKYSIGWMMTLYSLMGNRRKAQIRLVLEEWKKYNPVIGPVRGVKRGPYKKKLAA